MVKYLFVFMYVSAAFCMSACYLCRDILKSFFILACLDQCNRSVVPLYVAIRPEERALH